MSSRYKRSNKSSLSVLGCLLLIPFIIGCSAFSGWILMLLWNWLLPSLFGLPVLNFWKAWGLCILLSFIAGFFKSSK